MLQQEVDRLRKAAENPSTQSSYIVKAFEEENASLKSQLADLKKRLAEKDSALEQTVISL